MTKSYMYMTIASDEEKDICSLEARALYGSIPLWMEQAGYCLSQNDVDINRSPYSKWKLEILFHTDSECECLEQLQRLHYDQTYKLQVLDGVEGTKRIHTAKGDKQRLERFYAQYISGPVDLKSPELLLAICHVNHHIYFGKVVETKKTWQKHHNKPCQYSTALSTRLARTLINIAIPEPTSTLSFVDPCCGIGTVLLEAASLGVEVEGYDLNPVVLKGTRENLAYYHYDVQVKYKDMLDLTSSYDVAVLDLPYNLCSVLPEEMKRAMLLKLSQLAKRFVVVSIEPVEEILKQLKINIVDSAIHYKGKFKREVFLCGE